MQIKILKHHNLFGNHPKHEQNHQNMIGVKCVESEKYDMFAIFFNICHKGHDALVFL